MLYMLDANAVSDLIRNPHGRVMQRFMLAETGDVCTSIIVAAEMRFGAMRKQSDRLAARLEDILSVIPAQSFEAPMDKTYAEMRAEMERSGSLIGSHDMLIAAHALALDCILVTDNEREFRRVPGLMVENWLRPA